MRGSGNGGGKEVAARKQFLKTTPPDPELQRLLQAAKEKDIPEDELREQRISFAYGNAPANAERITKDSVRYASAHIRLRD
jgi:hypothetical protein